MILLQRLLALMACTAVNAAVLSEGSRPRSTRWQRRHSSEPLLGPLEGIPGIDATYDYVVIGGGTAGITIASRLAQQDFRVALIEAGDNYQLESFASVPGADVIGVGSSPKTKSWIDWGFVARRVPGADYRDIHYARGKCLGGSSALNFMIYQRPTIGSMRWWAHLVDDSSYLFDQAFSYFQKTIHFTPPDNAARFPNASAGFNPSAFQSNDGPVHVSYAQYAQPFSSWMAKGMEAIGIKTTRDFNSGTLFGSQYCSSTIRPPDEKRSSSEAAFFESSLPLLTLTVYKNTLAQKIVFDVQKRATGVKVRSSFLDLKFTLAATQEVILSAGAFQSPQLLMVSGIGPPGILSQYGINILSELPGVGQNMMDHVFFGPTYRVNVDTLTKLATDTMYLSEQIARYGIFHAGPLTNPVSDFLGWEKLPASCRKDFSATTETQLSKFPEDWPDAEYISGAGYVGNFSNLLKSQPRDGYQYATILGTLVAPTSRGNVTIVSADTQDLPVINPNWLATQTDQQVAVAIFKRVREAFHSEAMAPVILGEEYYPGPQIQTDEEILRVVQKSVMTVYHASCTCRMGKENDPMAVVDSKARVFGVQGLRVVDASAFPILPPGHPQSVVYMLAEKIAADIIAPQ